MLAAGHLAAYNEISAPYLTLVRLVFRTRWPLLPITIVSLPTTQKHFDGAGSTKVTWSLNNYGHINLPFTEMPTLPLLAGDLLFFASSPTLPLRYLTFLLFTSTINIVSRLGDFQIFGVGIYAFNIHCPDYVWLKYRLEPARALIGQKPMFYQSIKHRKSVFYCFSHVKSISLMKKPKLCITLW